MKKITFYLLMLFGIFQMQGQLVSNYGFTQSNGSYSPITGGTVLGTTVNTTQYFNVNATTAGSTSSSTAVQISAGFPIGFNFTFNGATCDQFSVSNKGYIVLGSSSSTFRIQNTNTRALWSNAVNNTLSAINVDLNGQTGSELSYLTTGVAPNRTLVVQWKNYRVGSTSTTDDLNFQIRLNETTNTIDFVYGTMTTTSTTTGSVGVRGSLWSASLADCQDRITTTDWSTTTAGVDSTADRCTLSSTVFPASGLTYTFSPPPSCTGTPTAGTVSPSLQTLCSGSAAAVITATGYTTGFSNITFQWEQSLDNFATAGVNAVGGSGATTVSYTPPAYAGTPIYYRLNVTCTSSAMSAYSTVATVTDPANPATQATALVLSNLGSNSATFNYTNGNGGNRRLIILSDAPIVDPTNGSSPALTSNAVYSGSGQQIVYDTTGGQLTVTNLTPNTTYYVKVYEYLRCGAGPYNYFYNVTGGTNATSFTTYSIPANDDCANAISLTVGANATSSPLLVDNTGATTSTTLPYPTTGFACGGTGFSTTGRDVWYSVVVPASGNVTIETALSGSSVDTALTVYTGNCTDPALTVVGCNNNGTTNAPFSSLPLTGLTPGATLLVRSYGANGVNGIYNIAAFDCPSSIAAPTGAASQSFCTSATVANLVATGTAIKWYTTATGGTAMASTDSLTTGTTYYASQTLACESFARLAVTVTLDTVPSTPTGSASQSYCSGSNATLASLVTTPTTITWYDAATAGAVLPATTTLVNGTTYYAEATSGTCLSAGRLAITVTDTCPVSGCLTEVNGQWPPSTYTPTTCDGAILNSVTDCGYGSEYSVVTVTLGQPYIFSSSITTDIITISTDNGATYVASGVGTVSWTSTLSGTIRFYTHLPGCLVDNACRIRGVVCGTPPTIAPDCPVLASPTSGAIDQSSSILLTWTAPTTGTPISSYNIYLDTSATPTTLVGNTSSLSKTISGLMAGTTYYWKVISINPAGQSTGCTSIFSFTTVAAPANDACSTPISLTPGVIFTDHPVNATLFGATTTAGLTPTCQQSYFSSDVWYTVVVPASGSLTLETLTAATNSETDTVIEAFTGTCGSLTSVGCNDDKVVATDFMSLLSLTGLTPGSTLYVAVWKYGTASATATTGSFQVSAYDASLSNSTFTSDNFKYYPNPVKDILNLTYSKNITKIKIINLLGQEVTAKSFNSTECQVDMTNLPSGSYIVKVTSDDVEKMFKVAKE